MREMVFNNILIADIVQKKAHFQSFDKGLNVVTGSDNHVGKSSLLKSLYHTLGANVGFDNVWGLHSKLFIVNFTANEVSYRISRFMNTFAVFQDDRLVLFTDSVTKELAPFLEKVFSFGVYLNEKNTDRVSLAPPVFTYLPYYIDQDKGWNALYESFENLTMYKKDDRLKSLYYHLNIYTKESVEKMARRDRLRDELDGLNKAETRLAQIIQAMNEEIEGLVPGENIEQLEANLEMHNSEISALVSVIGEKRNTVQQLQVSLEQHKYQQNIISEHISEPHYDAQQQHENSHSCPRCGYLFDEEIYDRVHAQYLNISDSYVQQHLTQVISDIEVKLQKEKEEYMSLLSSLRQLEKVYSSETDGFEAYVRHRGLSDSVERFTKQLGENKVSQIEKQEQITKLSNELRKLPQKDSVAKKYTEFTRLNIIQLGAWNPALDGKIKLLKPIKAQGTLENKIILAQFVGLFQTMNHFQSDVIRFPFVVDSPRGKEASQSSSKEILSMIVNTTILPQIILATVDFENYKDSLGESVKNANVITLTQQNALLDETDYATYASQIEEMHRLFISLSQNK